MLRGGSNNVMSSDKEVSLRGASEKIKFINQNIYAFNELKGGGVRERTQFQSLKKTFNEENFLTPGQISLIDVLYEKMMKGLGFDSFSSTYKHNPRKTLRH